MNKFVTRVFAGAVLIGLCGGSAAVAAQQAAAAKRLTVRTNRRIFYRAQRNTTATIVGNPVANGATFNLQLTPGGTQCFQLPASNWRTDSHGYRYNDAATVNGPINGARIRQHLGVSDAFELKVKARSPGITVMPGNPTLTYGTNFSIKGGGDEYCASTGTSTPIANTARVFAVKDDNNGACTIAACSPSGAFIEAVNLF